MGQISFSGSEWLQVFPCYQDEFPCSSMEEHSRPPRLIEWTCSYQHYTRNKKIMIHCEPGGRNYIVEEKIMDLLKLSPAAE